MVVDFLGKEDSKVEIVTHVHFVHKMGYGIQLEVSLQVEFVPQSEIVPQIEVSPSLRLTSNRNLETRSDKCLVPPTRLEPLGPGR
jgi:hypothetical protein